MVKVYNIQVLVSHLSIGCGPPRMRVPLPLDTKYKQARLAKKNFCISIWPPFVARKMTLRVRSRKSGYTYTYTAMVLFWGVEHD